MGEFGELGEMGDHSFIILLDLHTYNKNNVIFYLHDSCMLLLR